MRNPYENEPSDATYARAERAYDAYIAECDETGEAPLGWDDWFARHIAD